MHEENRQNLACGLHRKGVGGDRLSVSMLPTNRVDTGGREGGKCSSSVLLPR